MTDSLAVDPARLKAAGIDLRDQVLPAAPPPISATGSDPVSAAINQTLPIIESPVVDGLPDAQTAVTNTGSKIVTAAEMYAETDQLLGEHVGVVQFAGAGDQLPGGASTEQLVSATAGLLQGAETADEGTDTTPHETVTTNLNQLSAVMQATQPGIQGLQSVVGSVRQAAGSMGAAGRSPAELADDDKNDDTSKPDESITGGAQLVDATAKDGAGAAAGGQRSGSAPVQQPTEGQHEPAQSEREL
jgi:hypothetical protein